MEPSLASRCSVLFVDDEPNLLAALRRAMRSLEEEFEFHFASSAEDALERLSGRGVDIVVSDMRMPGVDGAAFLELMRRGHPETIRLVLSGQATLEATVRALSSTHQYLAKPYSFTRLRGLLHQITAAQAILPSRVLRKHVSQLSALPCRKAVVNDFRRAATSPAVERGELLKIARLDLGVMATIIHLALSINPDRSHLVTSLESALDMLSGPTLRALLASDSLFTVADDRFHGLDLERLTRHSLQVSETVQELGAALPAESQRYAALVGLLHDIGKLVLAEALGELCFSSGDDDGDSASELERQRELLGVGHAEVGAYLLAIWGLPRDIVEAVRDHHGSLSDSSVPNQLRSILMEANSLAHDKERQ
jgi:putative nucleotidyltransferase with HDIG domain